MKKWKKGAMLALIGFLIDKYKRDGPMKNKKLLFGIILVVVVVAALSGFWFFKAATIYDAAGFGRFGAPLTPLPLFFVSTNISSVDVLQGGSATIEVSIALRNLTGKPDTISLGLGSPVGEVPPFVNATFDPDTITINPGERVNSTLTLKIDSTAPTGRYLLSAYGKSSTFGAHDKYEGAFICGIIGYSFDLNVIPASGKIPEELPEYFYQNGVRILLPTPPKR